VSLSFSGLHPCKNTGCARKTKILLSLITFLLFSWERWSTECANSSCRTTGLGLCAQIGEKRVLCRVSCCNLRVCNDLVESRSCRSSNLGNFGVGYIHLGAKEFDKRCKYTVLQNVETSESRLGHGGSSIVQLAIERASICISITENKTKKKKKKLSRTSAEKQALTAHVLPTTCRDRFRKPRCLKQTNYRHDDHIVRKCGPATASPALRLEPLRK
jgi:hypothetical protein